MIITLELLLPSDDASCIVAALDAIAHRISEVGYDDAQFDHARNDAGKTVPFRVVLGTDTGRFGEP